MAEEYETGRFAHLIQPIRDLTANWEVDVASELGAYLSELGSWSTIVDSAGNTSLNFAEAALLIQGTTTVYSKKVEYLHRLVFDALNSVASKNRQKELRKERGDTTAHAGDEGDDEAELILNQDEEAFLSLDDRAIAEAENINLDDNDADISEPFEPSLYDATSSATFQRLSIDDKTEENGALTITSCAVHDSGALLLEPRDQKELDSDLNRVQHNHSGMARDGLYQHATTGDPPQAPVDDDDDDAPPPPPAMDDDDMGPAPANNDADDIKADKNPEQQTGNVISAPGIRNHGRTRGADETHKGDSFLNNESDWFDPWTPIDLDDAEAMRSKPLRKGKTWTELKYTCLRNENTRDVSCFKGVGEVPDPPKSLKDIVFPEFAYLLQSQRQKSSLQNQQAADAAYEIATDAPEPALEPAFDGSADDNAKDEQVLPPHCDEDDAPPAPPPIEDDDLEDEAGEIDPNEISADVDRSATMFEPTAAEQTYGERCKAHIDQCINAAAAIEVQTDMEKRISEWRERIRPHIEEQEQRGAFDVDERGGEVLELVRGSRCGRRFHELVCGEEKWQVCQTFAAVLQLATSRDVSLQYVEHHDHSLPDFTVSVDGVDEENEHVGNAPQQPQPQPKRRSQKNTTTGVKGSRKPLARLKTSQEVD